MNPASETHFVKKFTFVQGAQVLDSICNHLFKNEIDNILFGKWAAAIYTLELTNMGPYVLLIPPLYLNEKKDFLDQKLKELGFIESQTHKYIYENGDYRLILESQAILQSENQQKRNTVWREFYDMTFKTRSATSILFDYEEAQKPEHEEIRKKLKAYIDSRKFITRLSNKISIEINENLDSNGTPKKSSLEPIDLIHRIIRNIEKSPYCTPLKSADDLADVFSNSEKEIENTKKINAKRILIFQSICERLNIQSYLLRFYDATNRFKSFVCIEILLNNEWYLIDLSLHQTSIISTKMREEERYLNSVLKTRGTDCFEINLGEIEQEMQSEDQAGETIMMPKFT